MCVCVCVWWSSWVHTTTRLYTGIQNRCQWQVKVWLQQQDYCLFHRSLILMGGAVCYYHVELQYLATEPRTAVGECQHRWSLTWGQSSEYNVLGMPTGVVKCTSKPVHKSKHAEHPQSLHASMCSDKLWLSSGVAEPERAQHG